MAVDYKQYINGLNSAMPDADMNAAALAKRRWDSIAKPLGSLGKLRGLGARRLADGLQVFPGVFSAQAFGAALFSGASGHDRQQRQKQRKRIRW